MPIPSLLLALVIAGFIGSAFHVFMGGGRQKLWMYLGLSCVGFVLGHFVALWREIYIYRVGALETGVGVVGSLLALFGTIVYTRVAPYIRSGRV
jgi:hypothetical protein